MCCSYSNAKISRLKKSLTKHKMSLYEAKTFPVFKNYTQCVFAPVYNAQKLHCLTMTNCNRIWGILLHVIHRSSAAATITTSIHARIAKKSLIARHSVPSKYPRHSQRMWVRPLNPLRSQAFIWERWLSLRCLSLCSEAPVQPLCSLTSPPRPCFVPTLCPVERLAPTFSNHNYIPAEGRQQQQQQQQGETQHERGRGHHQWYVITRCHVQPTVSNLL